MSKNGIKSLLEGAKGQTVLINTDDWFIAPNGQQYKAVFGKLYDVCNSETTLGIKTNQKSTNWYACVGNMIVAGCQIHYVFVTDHCDCEKPYAREELVDGKIRFLEVPSRIWHAQ